VLHPIPSRATIFSVVLLSVAFSLAIHFANPVPYSLALGVPLIALGILIRLVTNSLLKKNQLVCRDGPYAFCRHPMYVGTISLGTGIALTLNHPLALALLAVAVAISIYRIRKEEGYLVAKLPEYAAYRREVPAFPTPGSVIRAFRSGRVPQPLSLKQCFRNGEVFRLNLYLPLILAAGLYLQRTGKLDVPDAAFVAGALVLLLLTAASFRLHPGESRRKRRDYLVPVMLELGILIPAALAIPTWTS
jgi:protein-S-isoprenylcysteine O-methyltransferase Ste14